jgi:hypothetical protein
MFRLAGLVDHPSFGDLSASTRWEINTFHSRQQHAGGLVSPLDVFSFGQLLLYFWRVLRPRKNSSNCEFINTFTYTLPEDGGPCIRETGVKGPSRLFIAHNCQGSVNILPK